ncbi:3-hydroxyacyl-ACP dehydratase FabZ [Corallococcus macrosporus]|uniref:3-hydroxyacyl-[acyl-carrier-protein] dehydratase FabZ n=2 Tax=Myxococcaceae TaxID=31 RepID=A0A250K0V8_9BACT|nr:3-hydroxyacyl-ACP dehydratase FabZ [Corallococcus macrosporus]AEI68196.1 beta-hydroxyacyl-(acyl-carrier-protein) dehydratase FabZ [Corallococcus macrosporus]ATB48986.1 beta-hydroxyacyl-ACP dehydratase [Corallococcus macrosporus DSM 14697]
MDIGEILNLLPHRYPFLLVDRVVEIVPGQKLTAYKNVTINEPFFNGHFPGHPVMPGVLILEALAQATAILAYKSENMDPARKLTYLMGVDGARFRKPVLPGDRLQLEIEVVRHKGAVWKTKGLATVDGARVAEGEFLATVVDKDANAAESAAS